MKQALLVIDLQNDYFPGGAFPLWNAETVLDNTVRAIQSAHARGIPTILVRHIADAKQGLAPFFNPGTAGAEIHPGILDSAPGAPVIDKHFADGFEKTNLEETLAGMGAEELLVCGMMTQNCVTHTAISRASEKYKVVILADCCTTVSEILHKIALNAVSTRLEIKNSDEVLNPGG